jgi:hypothetical protein
MIRHFANLTLFLISIFILSSTSIGQDLDDAVIFGTVSDPGAGMVAGAAVTAKLLPDGRERTVTTDDYGSYRMIELPPGRSVRIRRHRPFPDHDRFRSNCQDRPGPCSRDGHRRGRRGQR